MYNVLDSFCGEVININNEIFEFNKPSIDDTNFSVDEDDIINISGVTFFVDDNNIISGNSHRYWSGVEIALASLPENTSKVWSHPNLGNNVLTFEMLDFDLTYKVEHAGIARIMAIPLTTTPSPYTVYVNNISIGKFETKIGNSMIKSITAIVNKNDIIKVPDLYSRVIILPFEYPYIDWGIL